MLRPSNKSRAGCVGGCGGGYATDPSYGSVAASQSGPTRSDARVCERFRLRQSRRPSRVGGPSVAGRAVGQPMCQPNGIQWTGRGSAIVVWCDGPMELRLARPTEVGREKTLPGCPAQVSALSSVLCGQPARPPLLPVPAAATLKTYRWRFDELAEHIWSVG